MTRAELIDVHNVPWDQVDPRPERAVVSRLEEGATAQPAPGSTMTTIATQLGSQLPGGQSGQ